MGFVAWHGAAEVHTNVGASVGLVVTRASMTAVTAGSAPTVPKHSLAVDWPAVFGVAVFPLVDLCHDEYVEVGVPHHRGIP